jgi:hypothetical protein
MHAACLIEPLLALQFFGFCVVFFCLRVVPDAATAASGGSLLFAQYRPFAILNPKTKTEAETRIEDGRWSASTGSSAEGGVLAPGEAKFKPGGISEYESA